MKKEKPTVNIIGLGYIGLPTAALIASKKIRTIGTDINEKVVETINRGEIHIVEPDLAGLVKHVVDKRFLQAQNKPAEADVYLIAVPTPVRNNNAPDLSYVENAIRQIIPLLKPGNLIIIESTSPVGTTEKMYDLILNQRPELYEKIHMAYCPERVLPGKVLYELVHNDRAIGGINPLSTRKAMEFYQLFVQGDLYPTSARTAEMVKLVENASRDVQIAFANELSLISDKAGIDVWEVIELANKHPRVNILKPGTGVGGHCIAVDPWFIIHDFSEEARLIRMAREINTYKTQWVIEKIKNAALQFELENKRRPVLGIMGLAFKPDIDDLRESPALHIARSLQIQGFDLNVCEPNLNGNELKEFNLTRNMQKTVNDSDIILFLVAHSAFKDLKIPSGKPVLNFVNASYKIVN